MRKYTNVYRVSENEETGGWFVWRANVGGDTFFVEEFETKLAAEWRAAELRKLEEENREDYRED